MSKIKVAEIFGPTIQGEGPNVGVKTLFVRVTHCDFKCSWCDSKFAWNDSTDTVIYEATELADALVKKCKDTDTSHVVLTGGNPCIYDFTEVVNALHDNKIQVDVETQGSLYPDWLKEVDQIVISPKAPSSGQVDVFDKVNNFINNNQSLNIAIKIPVFNEEDFNFALKYYKLIETLNLSNIKMYLSVGNTDVKEEGDISKRILKDYSTLIDRVMNSEMKNVYILPQVHTLVWGNKQGV